MRNQCSRWHSPRCSVCGHRLRRDDDEQVHACRDRQVRNRQGAEGRGSQPPLEIKNSDGTQPPAITDITINLGPHILVNTTPAPRDVLGNEAEHDQGPRVRPRKSRLGGGLT